MSTTEIALIVLTLFAGGLVKGATGIGLPAIAIPILALFLDVPHAIAVMTVPLFITNAWQAWQHREHRRVATFLPPFLLASVAGLFVGTWFLTLVPTRALLLLLGVLLLAFISLRLWSPHFVIGRALGRRLAPFVGLATGALQGVSGFSGPIGITFISAFRLERRAYLFAVSMLFLLLCITQAVSLSMAGILDGPTLVQSVYAAAPVLIAMPLGTYISGRMDGATFDRVVLLFLAMIAVQLLVKAVG